jgi:hypothetical protein
MKRIGIFVSILVMVVGLCVSAYAALVDMGDGTIYDTDKQLSWLKNAGAGGLKNWADANTWAASLNAGSGFAGFTNWRLPAADPTCNGGGGGYNCTNSEMGHLYYTELGNTEFGPLTNSGPFTNMQADIYWSGTEFAPYPPDAWFFRFYDGVQYAFNKVNDCYAWAVRPGLRSVPAPSTSVPASGTVSLIVLGVAGLTIVGMRLRKANS